MSTSHTYNTRSAAKRKRLDNQGDAPRASKVQQTNSKFQCIQSVAAEKAEMIALAERKRMESEMKARAPEDELDPAQLASSSTQPELRLYGWPFTYEYMLEYARRHHLSFPVAKGARKLFGGKQEFKFEDLTEEHYSNSRLRSSLYFAAAFMTLGELEKVTSLQLEMGRPYSLDWDGIIYMWSNYDMDSRWYVADKLQLLDAAVETLDRAMNEGVHGKGSRLQWWYTFDNDVSRYTSGR